MNDIIEQECERILRLIPARNFRGKNILVTGANGFLGKYITRTLMRARQELEGRCSVTGMSLNLPVDELRSFARGGDLKFIRRDLSRPFKMKDSFDLIFHAAGYGQPAKFVKDPFSTVAINTTALHTLMNALSPSGTFVFFSSAEIYGEIPPGMKKTSETYRGNCDTLSPRAVYAESKRLGEALCNYFIREKKKNIKIARISHTYGPGLGVADSRVMSEFIRRAHTEKKIALLDAGRAVKTYGYIADTAAMLLFIGVSGKDSLYNVGGENVISIREMAEKIGNMCNVPVVIPKASARAAHIGRDPQLVRLDLSKIKKEMKSLSFTPFDEGLRRTIAWPRM